jgi:hypothetical protein
MEIGAKQPIELLSFVITGTITRRPDKNYNKALYFSKGALDQNQKRDQVLCHPQALDR